MRDTLSSLTCRKVGDGRFVPNFYMNCRSFIFACITLFMSLGHALAEPRTALVIGNAAYQSAPALKTPAVDAEVVAETLRAANFDVTELHDVRQGDIGQVMRGFLDKLAANEPGGVAFLYFSGYGAQANGESYLVPVDAVVDSQNQLADEAFRLKELLDEMMTLPLTARLVVLDAARDHNFSGVGGRPLAKGLAAAKAVPGTLLAYAAAPSTLAIDGDNDYSLYTGAMVTAMRQPGLPFDQVLARARQQVSQETGGAQTPWTRSAVNVKVRLFEDAQAQAQEPAKEQPARRRRSTPSGAAIIRRLLRPF